MFDCVVIGGGPGGYKATELLSRAGYSVALIEKNKIGGVCLNEGCIPFKTYLHTSRIKKESDKLLQDKQFTGESFQINQENVYLYKEKIINMLTKSIENMLKAHGASVFFGEALIEKCNDGSFSIKVGNDIIECKKLIIATGSKEVALKCDNDLSIKMIGSHDMLELTELPEQIEIVGAGAIGLEAASYFSDLGCKVILAEASDKIGGHIDSEISDALKRILEKKGIKVYTNTFLSKINQGKVYHKYGEEQIVTEPNLVITAVGRISDIDEEMLKTAEVRYDKSGIIIDNQCRTSNKNIYACGDVTGKVMLAHTAYAQAKVISDSISGKTSIMNYDLIPKVIYSNPEVLTVGMTEEDCKEKNISYTAKSLPMTYSGKYFAENGKDGAKAKMIIDENKKVIGFHMIANGASELSIFAELMIANQMTISDVKNLIFAHPTYGEIIYELVFEF